jgi:CheY-like chemotaxis protein
MNTILVVQEGSGTREIICKTLKRKGYHTVGVGNGKAAYEYLLLYPDTVRLVLTAYHLPDCTGFELKKKIARIHGSVPVVFSSEGLRADKTKQPDETEELFRGINSVLQYAVDSQSGLKQILTIK